MVHDISHDKGTDTEPKAPAASDQLVRDQAVKQIERRQHFWMRATMGTLFILILAVIWVLAQYHNAGGWPTKRVQPELGHRERVELLDHLPGHRVGAADRGGRLVGLRPQAGLRSRDPARDEAPGRPAALTAGGMPRSAHRVSRGTAMRRLEPPR